MKLRKWCDENLEGGYTIEPSRTALLNAELVHPPRRAKGSVLITIRVPYPHDHAVHLSAERLGKRRERESGSRWVLARRSWRVD